VATSNGTCPASVNFSIININSTLTAIANVTQPLCNGITGTVTITPSGGTIPYNYKLNGGTAQSSNIFSNLSAGVYNVIVTDANGCTFSTGFNVTAPTIIFAEIITNTNETCAGTSDGSATVNATGGTSPFTYLWPVSAGSQITPTATGLTSGAYTVTVTDMNGCHAHATVNLTAGPTATAFAGLNDTICSTSTYTLSGATVSNATTITWTTLGTGTFNNMFAVKPVYTPSAADIASGGVILVMSAQSASPCAAATDTMLLTIIPQAVVNAGADDSICVGSTFTTTASASNYTNLIWTTSGTGTFNSATLINPVYTPSALDIFVGGFTLTLTGISNATCANAVDHVVVNIINSVVANAGPDQTIYAQNSVIMNANNPAPGTGHWTLISGPSVPFIVNPTNPNTSVTGLTSGTYIFRWNITNNPCPNTWDDVVINNISSADLEVTKTVSNVNPIAGSQITYTITVTNNGPSAAMDVVLTDILPAGLTQVGVTPSIGSWTAPLWTIGTLNSGQSETLQLFVNVNSNNALGAQINNVASVNSSTFDPDLNNNTDNVVITVYNYADLMVTKTANSSTVIAGDIVTYTISVTNNGPSVAQNVVVNDNLPAGLSFVSATSTVGTWSAPNWSFGSLNVGSTQTLTIIATVNGGLVNGSLIGNTAVVTSSTQDPNLTNNTSTSTIAVSDLADLSITKTASQNPILAGDTLIYTITVTNNGYSNAQNVVATDILPGGLTFVSATPSVGTWNTPDWNIGTLNNNNIATLSMVTIVNSNVLYGTTIINTAAVTSTTPDPVLSNNNATEFTNIITNSDLSITKTANNDTIIAGDNVTYTITVTNNGISDAQNVIVSDILPTDLTLVSALPSTGIWNNPQWTIGTLAASGHATITIVATVNSNTPNNSSVSNTVNVSSTTPDPDLSNNTSTYIIHVIQRADLYLTKSSNHSVFYPGDTVTYTINVKNLGLSDAQNVNVTDVLPAGLTYLNGTPSTGTWFYPYWHIGNMLYGATASLLIEAIINSNDSGGYHIINIASVTSDTYDPDTTNNHNQIPDALITIAETDLAITKVAEKTSVTAGTDLNYTITLTNNGPIDSYLLVITDDLPQGLKFISASDDGIYDSNTNTIKWNWPMLAVNETVTFSLKVMVDKNLAGGTIVINKASVLSKTSDSNMSNNTAYEFTTVESIDRPFIPQGFSPNGNGQNDVFVITGLEKYPNHKFTIYNRWGDKVFEAAPYNNDWDGTNKFGVTVGGDQLPVGTYFYIFETGISGQAPFKGFIYLTR